MTKKPEVSDIFFEVMFSQVAPILFFCVLFSCLFISIVGILLNKKVLRITKEEENSEEKQVSLRNENKAYWKWFIINFVLITLCVAGQWEVTKKFTSENNKHFLSIEQNRVWFLENIDTIYSDLKQQEYNINKIISVKKITQKHDHIYFDDKARLMSGKERTIIKYLSDKDLFEIEMIVVDEQKKVQKITVFSTLEVDDNAPEDKAFIFNTNDSIKDSGENIMYGDIILKEAK
jgi:hypothetical protein